MTSKSELRQNVADECDKADSPNTDGSGQGLAFPISPEMEAWLNRMKKGIRRAAQDELFRKEIAKRAS